MKIYYKDGKTEMDIMPVDLANWQSQGWTTSKPTVTAMAKPAAQTSMDATTVAKFMQAYGRSPNATDLANWRYDAATVNRQLDAAIASKSSVPTVAKASPSAVTPYGGMDTATIAKFSQAYGRTPNDTDIANWKYNPSAVNRQLDSVIASKTSVPASSSASAVKKFYRIGVDIYDASTNQKIGATDWNSNWSGKATEVAAPTISGSETIVPTSPAATNAFADKYVSTYEEMEKNGDLEGMDDNQKELTVMQEVGITAGTADEQELAKQYLAKAKELADPYYKSMVNVALDELERSVTSTEQDLTYKKNQIDVKIDELKSDLTYNKEQLSLDEQTEMSQQLKAYETARDNLDLQMQEAGLAFSSPRKLAEKKLETEQSEVAQSIGRKYANQLREQELAALRASGQLEQERGLAERTATENKTAAVRATEAKVGSAALPSLPGVTALGGIVGSIEDQRKSAILSLEKTIAERNGEVPTY